MCLQHVSTFGEHTGYFSLLLFSMTLLKIFFLMFFSVLLLNMILGIYLENHTEVRVNQ